MEPVLQRREIRMIGDLIQQEFQMTADFPRRHDGRDVELLEFQLSWRRRLGREMSRLATAPGSQRGVDQRTKRVRHDRVEDQVDTALAPSVFHPVPAETVEQPAFPCRHVNRLISAGEQHLRVGDDRDVDSDVGPPMVMHVDVQRHFRAGSEPHQTASAPYASELGHHPLDVGQPREFLRGTHRALEVVSGLARHGDQPDRLIAFIACRMRDPGGLRKPADLLLE